MEYPLSHDVVSGSDITPCNKIDKPLADYRFIENIYFFEVNQIYYIECGGKIHYFSRVRSTSENADIFTARDEIYLVFAEKK